MVVYIYIRPLYMTGLQLRHTTKAGLHLAGTNATYIIYFFRLLIPYEQIYLFIN